MSVTITKGVVDASAVGLGETIYGDGSSTTGTRGAAAPGTWQETQELVNSLYAEWHPTCLRDYDSAGEAWDTGGAATTTNEAVVHVPRGATTIRLTAHGLRDAAATSLVVTVQEEGTTRATCTLSSASATTVTATGTLSATGNRRLTVQVTSNGTNGGTLYGYEVQFGAIAAGSIPATGP